MKFKKELICFLLSGAVLLLGNTPATVATVYGADAPSASKVTKSINLRAEQTEWYYRFVDDKLQKHLWSITYDKWLTDWQWV